MPLWAIIYANVFVGILIVNTIFWLQVRQKPAIILYHVLAGFYLVMLFIAYWTPALLFRLHPANVVGLALIVLIDMYISLWIKKDVDIKKLMPHLDEESASIARQFGVVEIAKSVGLLISAPAYIVGFMVAYAIFIPSS